MKLVKTVLGVLVATALFTAAAFAADTTTPVVQKAEVDSGWTLSLSGVGSSALNGAKVQSSAIGGEFELGHDGKFILPLNAGVRQSIGYADVNGSTWLFSTKVFSDFTLIRLGSLEFDAGGNAGVGYGNTTLTYTAAPEAVVRLYLKRDVDFFGRVEYPFNLSDGRAENRLTYVLGLRVRF